MKTIIEQREELKDKINKLLDFRNLKSKKYNKEETALLCDIKNIKLRNNIVTHSEIKLVKDTDWHTDYDIFIYYFFENEIDRFEYNYISTNRNKYDFITPYLDRIYPIEK